MTVLAVAYGTQEPSLAVAEFAPTAGEAIESPPSTAANAAAGSGSGRSQRSTTTTSSVAAPSSVPVGATSPPTTQVGRSRVCYGNPPRQIEDPMAPPCVATIFEGDNGGATSRGVSSTEVRVAIPGMSPTDTGTARKVIDGLFAFVNERFELYGRRLVPVYVSGSAAAPAESRALGAAIASQGVFAAVTGWIETATQVQVGLLHELARQGVVAVARNVGAGWTDELVFDPYHPYLWSAWPSAEDQQANIADLACRAMAGRPAQHAGDPNLRDKTRRFAILAYGWKVPPRTKALDRLLTECTGERPLLVEQVSGAGSLRVAFEKLAAEGATTIVGLTEAWSAYDLMGAVQTSTFRPEWILPATGTESGYDEWFVQNYGQGFGEGLPIRLSAGPKLLPVQARAPYAIVPYLDSSLVAQPSGAGFVNMVLEVVYSQFLALAAGIQGAGPNLTPESFAAALMGMQFPNPGAGQAPHWQPSTGFGPGDHSLFDDYHVGWWSSTAAALDTGWSPKPFGSWCYLGQGTRFRVGTYPANADDLLFNDTVPCR